MRAKQNQHNYNISNFFEVKFITRWKTTRLIFGDALITCRCFSRARKILKMLIFTKEMELFVVYQFFIYKYLCLV